MESKLMSVSGRPRPKLWAKMQDEPELPRCHDERRPHVGWRWVGLVKEGRARRRYPQACRRDEPNGRGNSEGSYGSHVAEQGEAISVRLASVVARCRDRTAHDAAASG